MRRLYQHTSIALLREFRSTLSLSEIESYQCDGYLVIKDFTKDTESSDSAVNSKSWRNLENLSKAVKESVVARRERFVPANDRQHQPSNVEIKTKIKEALPAEQRQQMEAMQSSGMGPPKDTIKFDTREKKIKIRCRNQKEVDRTYQKIVELRKKYSQYKNMDLESRDTNGDNISNNNDSNSNVNKKPHFSTNSDDDIDVNQYGKEEAKRSFEKYQESGQLERDIRKGSHLDEALAHVYNGAQCWAHVALYDDKLKSVLLSPNTDKDDKQTSHLARAIGEISAQLAGAMTTRLYADSIVQRTPYCNSSPFHVDAAGLNYRDPRGLQATVVLPGCRQPLDSNHGGYVVLPGSHLVIRDITNNCQDMTSFVRPAAWEVGESLRLFPKLLEIQPKVIETLEPGSLLLMNNLLMYSISSSFATSASEEALDIINQHRGTRDQVGMDGSPGKRKSDLVKALLDDAPLTYTLSVMPDGVVFDGCRNTWMSKDSHGPLYGMEAGQPLRDNNIFPILFTEIDDLME